MNEIDEMYCSEENYNKIMNTKSDHQNDRDNPFINAARGRDRNGVNNDEIREDNLGVKQMFSDLYKGHVPKMDTPPQSPQAIESIKTGNMNIKTGYPIEDEEDISLKLLGSILSNIINQGELEKNDAQVIYEIVEELKKYNIYYERK